MMAAMTLRLAVAGLALPAALQVPGHPAGGTAGVGISADPVCAAAPLQPGHATVFPAVTVTNTGTTSGNITVRAEPVGVQQELYRHGYTIPASWVSVTYPRHLFVFTQHSVNLKPGTSANVPVSVTVPSGARPGAYVADLVASESADGSGASGVEAHLAAGAATYLLFTVGIRQPSWPPRLLGLCWGPTPGHYAPWPEWSGTSQAVPPPGWHWVAATAGAPTTATWAYTPPRGWSWNWSDPSNPRQVYRGRKPHPCVNGAAYGDGAPGGGPWVGGQYPDTSTKAGCAAWLAASVHGTLTAEPAGTATRQVTAASTAGSAPGMPPAGWLLLAGATVLVVLVQRLVLR